MVTHQLPLRAMSPSTNPFDALGDANRRAILELLGDGDRSVREVADALPISRPAVSKHLRLLKQAGLIDEERRGTRSIYRVRAAGLDAVRAYLEQVWGDAAARVQDDGSTRVDIEHRGWEQLGEARRSGAQRKRAWLVDPDSPLRGGSRTMSGNGTPDSPWQLKTPPGSSAYAAYRDEASDPPALVMQVGKTQVRYQLRAIDDLHAMLKQSGDWVPLGSADEGKDAAPGTVESWARADDNPVGGWYGLKKGLRGRFANYVPPVLEELGLAEVEHNARNNRMRAK